MERGYRGSKPSSRRGPREGIRKGSNEWDRILAGVGLEKQSGGGSSGPSASGASVGREGRCSNLISGPGFEESAWVDAVGFLVYGGGGSELDASVSSGPGGGRSGGGRPGGGAYCCVFEGGTPGGGAYCDGGTPGGGAYWVMTGLVKCDRARDLAEMRARGKGELAVEETGS
jgi:hypothetical protein